MFSSNILPSFSLAQWVILFFICIPFFYILKKDVISRLIPNIFILLLVGAALVWNTEIYIQNRGFFQENMIQLFLLIIIGYSLYGRNSIGAGDIKLALVLSLFFLSFSSPLIFLGNTAVITIIFIIGYIIGGSLHIYFQKDLQKEFGLFLAEKSKQIHKKYLSKGIGRMGWIFFQENREMIKNQFAIFLILIGIRFCITHFLVAEIPSLALLGTNTSLILGFYILSPLLYQYIEKYKKDIWWKIGLLMGIMVFLVVQKDLFSDFLSLFFQSTLLLSLFLLIFFILRNIIGSLLLFIDRKWIPISKVKDGDILNIPATRYFWKNISKNNQPSLEKIFSETLHIAPPSFLRKDGDLEIQAADQIQFWGYVSRMPGFLFPYISIQQTVPYGIFLIIGFLFTLFFHIHLTKMMIDGLRQILHI